MWTFVVRVNYRSLLSLLIKSHSCSLSCALVKTVKPRCWKEFLRLPSFRRYGVSYVKTFSFRLSDAIQLYVRQHNRFSFHPPTSVLLQKVCSPSPPLLLLLLLSIRGVIFALPTPASFFRSFAELPSAADRAFTGEARMGQGALPAPSPLRCPAGLISLDRPS